MHIGLIKNDTIKEIVTTYPVYEGIKYVEQLTKRQEGHFILPPEVTSMVNHYVQENGFGYMEIEYAVNSHDFEQILDTVKNRLQDFILELGENWNTKEPLPAKELLNNLVSVHIYNNQSQGGQMSTVFDQRGQTVNTQYNAAGEIKISLNDKDDFVAELEKIRFEIGQAKNSQNLDQDVAIEAEYHILQASKEAQKSKPDKKSFIEHIKKAKTLLTDVAAVAGIVTALSKIIEVAQNLLQ